MGAEKGENKATAMRRKTVCVRKRCRHRRENEGGTLRFATYPKHKIKGDFENHDKRDVREVMGATEYTIGAEGKWGGKNTGFENMGGDL